MIKINKNNNVFYQPTFQGNKVQSANDFNFKDLSQDPVYSNAISSYGKAIVESSSPRDDVDRKLFATSDYETISLEDAVKELKDIQTTPKKKADYILCSTFENDKTDVIINKKALLTIKQALLYGDKIPKMEDVIRTCLDVENQTFNSHKFDFMFDYKGRLKIGARLKPRPQNYAKELRQAKASRRVQIERALENNPDEIKKVEFKESDLFISIDNKKANLSSELKQFQEQTKELPDDLYQSMQKSIENNEFDLKKVFVNHYSLLDDCKTIDEVQTFYPELEYPKEKPEFDPSGSKDYLYNRFANEDLNKVVISTLKQGYINLKPKSDIKVAFENSMSPKLQNMERAGFEFSAPSNDLLKVLAKGEKLYNKYLEIPNYTDKEIKDIANKRAIRTSKVWSDYSEMTSREWLPVRLIKHKRKHPEDSQYSTEKMVNTYLAYLYNRNPEREYPTNPLEKFDDKNYLSKGMKNVINGTYWARYSRYDEVYADNPDFQEFKSKFDTDAMSKSFEHIENNYTNSFFHKYWTNERIETLKKEMQPAYDLIYEKIALKEQIQPKIVTNEDVNELIESYSDFGESDRVPSEDIAKFKFITSEIKDKDLKNRCQSCVSDIGLIDRAYFDSMNNIITVSTENGKINEDKAIILIELHDKYLNQILNNDEEISEEEYIEKHLNPYKDGESYDYKSAKSDIRAEDNYFSANEKLEQQGQTEFSNLIMDKFIMRQKPNYKDANKIISYYEDIQSTFKDKFLSSLKSMSKIKDDIMVEELGNLHSQITSWNYDNDEEIIMDKDKFPQKVVITQKAKHELWHATGENIDLFDNYINKFYSAAQTRTGEKGGQGIKKIQSKPFHEIKILGNGGGLRMYTREVTPEDEQKYNKDGINVKYIFDTCDGHL